MKKQKQMLKRNWKWLSLLALGAVFSGPSAMAGEKAPCLNLAEFTKNVLMNDKIPRRDDVIDIEADFSKFSPKARLALVGNSLQRYSGKNEEPFSNIKFVQNGCESLSVLVTYTDPQTGDKQELTQKQRFTKATPTEVEVVSDDDEEKFPVTFKLLAPGKMQMRITGKSYYRNKDGERCGLWNLEEWIPYTETRIIQWGKGRNLTPEAMSDRLAAEFVNAAIKVTKEPTQDPCDKVSPSAYKPSESGKDKIFDGGGGTSSEHERTPSGGSRL